MSNINVIRIVSEIEKLVVSSDFASAKSIEEKKLLVSSLIGAVTGLTLYIPATITGNVRLLFQETLLDQLKDIISTINESYNIDIDLAMDSAYTIWLQRYRLVHTPDLDSLFLLQRLNATLADSKNQNVTEFEIEKINRLGELISSSNVEKLDNLFAVLFKELENLKPAKMRDE